MGFICSYFFEFNFSSFFWVILGQQEKILEKVDRWGESGRLESTKERDSKDQKIRKEIEK